jgi:hypothetical protein
MPTSSVLAYRKYAPRDSPPASLGLDRNTPAFLGKADQPPGSQISPEFAAASAKLRE